MSKPTPDDVEKYYDNFSHEILVENFLTLNLRQAEIISLCQEYVKDNDNIFEIGCGVGIITKTLKNKASSILATDLSPKNIEIARDYLAEISNCEVQVLNVLKDDFPCVQSSIDTVILADVIEHIPTEKRAYLFQKIDQILAPNGRVILSLPSPEYQQYIKKFNPERLQVVDETVHIRELLNDTNLDLLYFRYIDVWYPNQYIHIVLQKGIFYKETSLIIKSNFMDRIKLLIRKKIWYLKHYTFVKRIKK